MTPPTKLERAMDKVRAAREHVTKAEDEVLVARSHAGAMAVAAVEAGASVTAVADEMGVTRATVYSWIRASRG